MLPAGFQSIVFLPATALPATAATGPAVTAVSPPSPRPPPPASADRDRRRDAEHATRGPPRGAVLAGTPRCRTLAALSYAHVPGVGEQLGLAPAAQSIEVIEQPVSGDPGGAEFGPPGIEVNLLYIAALLALVWSDPTVWSVDRWRFARRLRSTPAVESSPFGQSRP